MRARCAETLPSVSFFFKSMEVIAPTPKLWRVTDEFSTPPSLLCNGSPSEKDYGYPPFSGQCFFQSFFFVFYRP